MLRRFYYLSLLGVGLCITALASAASKETRSSENQGPRQSTVVVIDAGHGGFDRGGISGQRVAESTMNLDVALRLRTLLQASGYRVVMTRDRDVFVTLGNRVAIANQYRNGIFVCIHFNSARRSGASGIETYFYSQQSLTLASAIHYNVAGGAPSSNRGVRRRGFYVLRNTRIPAVLVECGFLTNPTEARYALNSAYRQKLAEEIARGVNSRNSVRGSSLGTNVPSVPLQPFIDQTRFRDPDLSRSKRSKKSARRKSTKSKKSPAKESSDDQSLRRRNRAHRRRRIDLDSPIVTSAQMRAAEEAAFAQGVEVEALMDQAGAGVARTVRQFFPRPQRCVVFCGKGHNGGDALVAAENLKRSGWKIDIRLAFPESECSELTRKKLKSLRDAPENTGADEYYARTIVLDGLLGLGTQSLLREPIRGAARTINQLRAEQNAFVFAVDLPTGLNADNGEFDPDCVIADCTVTIGFGKHGLIVDLALDVVGRLEVVPLVDLVPPEAAPNETLATAHSLSPLLPRRKFGAYKNQFGRVGVVAGSKGFVGAALMTTEGALRAGAGLVEVFVPDEIYPIVASAAPAEAMVKSLRSYGKIPEDNIDVWAVGPGLGTAHASHLQRFIQHAEKPMVVDADALNILAKKIDVLKKSEGKRLLTPHPGEMERLIHPGKMTRAWIARNVCENLPVTLLFKGSRTVVCESSRPLSYNTTGNPGMATGGMGDILTGVCAGLAAQGLSLYDAARVGAWVCGRAAEISIFNANASQESLLPRDVLQNLGAAFNDLHHPSIGLTDS